MRRLAVALAVTLLGLASATAQITTKGPPSDSAVTPAEMDRRLEEQALRIKERGQHADRVALVDFAWPLTVEEYRANAKFVVVLIVAVSNKDEELPLKQFYVRAEGRMVPLQKIASQRRMVPEDAVVAFTVGRFREDSFYLAPASVMMRRGELLVDFAANRSGFRLYQLPGTPPDFVRADRDPSPKPGAQPEPKALRALIEREYPGFELPADLR